MVPFQVWPPSMATHTKSIADGHSWAKENDLLPLTTWNRSISTVDSRTVSDCWPSSVQCRYWRQASSTSELISAWVAPDVWSQYHWPPSATCLRQPLAQNTNVLELRSGAHFHFFLFVLKVAWLLAATSTFPKHAQWTQKLLFLFN